MSVTSGHGAPYKEEASTVQLRLRFVFSEREFMKPNSDAPYVQKWNDVMIAFLKALISQRYTLKYLQTKFENPK